MHEDTLLGKMKKGKRTRDFTEMEMKEFNQAIEIALKRGKLKNKVSDDGSKVEFSLPLPHLGSVKNKIKAVRNNTDAVYLCRSNYRFIISNNVIR